MWTLYEISFSVFAKNKQTKNLKNKTPEKKFDHKISNPNNNISNHRKVNAIPDCTT